MTCQPLIFNLQRLRLPESCRVDRRPGSAAGNRCTISFLLFLFSLSIRSAALASPAAYDSCCIWQLPFEALWMRHGAAFVAGISASARDNFASNRLPRYLPTLEHAPTYSKSHQTHTPTRKQPEAGHLHGKHRGLIGRPACCLAALTAALGPALWNWHHKVSTLFPQRANGQRKGVP